MASLCALRLVHECGNYDRGEGANAVSLRLHCGISSGFVHCMRVGLEDRWEFFVSGSPISSIAEALNAAGTGDVCLCEESYRYVQDILETKRVANTSVYLLTGKRLPEKVGRNIHRRREVDGKDKPPTTTDWHSEDDSAASQQALAMRRNRLASNGGDSQLYVSSALLASTAEDEKMDYVQITTNSNGRLTDLGRAPALPVQDSAALPSHMNFQGLKSEERIISSASAPIPAHDQMRTTLTVISAIHRFTGRVLRSATKSTNPFSRMKSSTKVAIDNSEPLSSVPEVPLIVGGAGKGFVAKGKHDLFHLLEEDPYVQDVKEYLQKYINVPVHHSETDDRIMAMATDVHLANILRRFVHVAARSTMEIDGELRLVTTLFVEFLGLQKDLLEGKVKQPQRSMEVCLKNLNLFGGSLRQYTVDDKGCVAIIAFGLPGSSHEDNSRRAVEAALALRKDLDAVNISSRQGIAEGQVFCGLVGSADRCEYAIMGASVNL
eukprot:gene4221-5332_t